MQAIGNINEKGYLYSLSKQGFNHHKCILELIANSIDANAKKITFLKKQHNISMIDNGSGMCKEKLTSMFSMQKANHVSDKSCGISGIGGKVALMILSGKQEVTIYTFDGINDYLKVCIPWNRMFEQGKYTNMISVTIMTEEEKILFKNDVVETGTIIKFPYNETLNYVIEDNFKNSNERDSMPILNDMASIVFGRFTDTEIFYKNLIDDQNNKQLLKYNYFEGTNADFYLGKAEETIRHYQHITSKDNLYIWDNNGEDYVINKKGKGYAKSPSKLIHNLNNYNEIGEFNVFVGQRIDTEVFDIHNPISYDELNKRYRNIDADLHTSYDKITLPCNNGEDLHETVWQWLTEIPLVRNNQQIGKFSCPDIKPSSARGSAEGYHNYFGVRCELHYNPICNHENRQDEAMNIQQNKNQWQPSDMDINLTRLVKAIRKKKSDKIWENWKELSTNNIDQDQEDQLQEHEDPLQEHEDQLQEHEDPLQEHEDPVQEHEDPVQEHEEHEDQVQEHEDQVQEHEDQVQEHEDEVQEHEDQVQEHEEPLIEVDIPHTISNRPITISSHRRGTVSGSELKEEIMRIYETLNDDENYVDTYVILFNQLRNIV